MVKHAEKRLRNASIVKSESYGIFELRDNWHYLGWAIKSTLEKKVRTRDLPFADTQEYWKAKENASDVKRFLHKVNASLLEFREGLK